MQSFSPKKIGTGEIATAGNSSGRDVFRSDVCRQIRRSAVPAFDARESRRDSAARVATTSQDSSRPQLRRSQNPGGTDKRTTVSDLTVARPESPVSLAFDVRRRVPASLRTAYTKRGGSLRCGCEREILPIWREDAEYSRTTGCFNIILCKFSQAE